MKKTTLTILLNLIITVVFGQSFPGNNPELLLNKTLKPVILDKVLQEFGYKNFYLEFNEKKKQFTKEPSKNKPFKLTSKPRSSEYNKLVGKEFQIVQIFEIDSPVKKYALELENKEIGKLYYEYDPFYKTLFEFEVVGGLDYPEDYFCNEIKFEKDKFDKSERYDTPSERSISFSKFFRQGKPIIYISIYKLTNTIISGGNCLKILFDDGKTLDFTRDEAKIKRGVGQEGLDYFASFELNEEEIKLLSEKNIAYLRICTDDLEVDKLSAKKIKSYLKCLMK